MQTLQDGYRAFGLLWDVNWDRLLFPSAILMGLLMGGFLGTLGLF
jgi:hypothetical protein